MCESDGACFDDDGYLATNIGVGGHAICGGVAELGAGHNHGGAHFGGDVGWIKKS